ncbi:MAG TPA: hypothetical protein VGI81_02375 [Tepidisphaeraceae bacterium]|jgi:5-methylcytosine-specific restriction enzyme subunit McrC
MFKEGQIVYPCKEYEEVSLPVKNLLGTEGTLDIYPDVAGKGYFDIDYRKGELVLKARGFVGLIPISDKAAIRVEPRTPIPNLLYMIWRSGVQLSGLSKYVRGYRETPGTVADPERLYVNTFLSTMRSAGRTGLLKRYIRAETEQELRGRVLLGKTVSRFRSHGIRHKHTFEIYDHTVNNLENRILKATAQRLLQRFSGDTSKEGREISIQLRDLLRLFDPVNAGPARVDQIARETPRLIRSLPRSHKFYEPALWLAYLIATRSGVKMEAVGRAKFESVVIDMADLFERYIRKVCEEKAATCFSGCRVMNGNRDMVPLFLVGEKFPAKPDIYFKRQRVCVAVADAKYKPKIASEDRYELLAFCEALGVDTAAFVCPKMSKQSSASLHGTTVGGRTVHAVRIDLTAPDPEVEELDFARRLGRTLGIEAVGNALDYSI